MSTAPTAPNHGTPTGTAIKESGTNGRRLNAKSTPRSRSPNRYANTVQKVRFRSIQSPPDGCEQKRTETAPMVTRLPMCAVSDGVDSARSEEHTSELQSLRHL